MGQPVAMFLSMGAGAGGGRAAPDAGAAVAKARARRVSTVSLPAIAAHMRQLAVHAMVFLETRPQDMHVG